jgi:aspartyl/asparaginyl beta-hydroxylase (cupin superfamily)
MDPSKIISDSNRLGCPQIIPGIQGIPIWSRETFPWLNTLEDHVPHIRQEFLSLQYASIGQGFQRYSDSSVSTGQWNVCYLYLHSLDFSGNRNLCPITDAMIR